MKSSKLVIVFCLFFISSCIESGSKSTRDPLGLNGKWISNCYLNDNVERSYIDEHEFSGFSSSVYSQFFSNSSCSGTPFKTVTGTMKFTIGDTVMTSDGVEAIEVDLFLSISGTDYEVLDLIRINEDIFNFGVYDDGTVRPTRLDYDVTFTRQ